MARCAPSLNNKKSLNEEWRQYISPLRLKEKPGGAPGEAYRVLLSSSLRWRPPFEISAPDQSLIEIICFGGLFFPSDLSIETVRMLFSCEAPVIRSLLAFTPQGKNAGRRAGRAFLTDQVTSFFFFLVAFGGGKPKR